MTTTQKVQDAIRLISEGYCTQYINCGGKTIRVSNHAANPERTDDNTVSLVIDNEGQSYMQDRGRFRASWERSNEWYVSADGQFTEQFDSIESFLNWFDID